RDSRSGKRGEGETARLTHLIDPSGVTADAPGLEIHQPKFRVGNVSVQYFGDAALGHVQTAPGVVYQIRGGITRIRRRNTVPEVRGGGEPGWNGVIDWRARIIQV